jgi:mRNA-degrading endonuclease RelE of RelBE toxin-antitoxin system
MTNNIVSTKTFARLLNKKKREGSLKYIYEKVEETIGLLKESRNPEEIGESKKANLKGTYSIRLNDWSRILYTVNRVGENLEVTLLRVCNHKQVYGKD